MNGYRFLILVREAVSSSIDDHKWRIRTGHGHYVLL